MATKLEFLVAKKKMLAALATVSVAISSPVGWKHHEVPWGEYYNSTPSPPRMRDVLKTSEKACTVRAYLGWKNHEAPWGEYYNSTPSHHG